MKKRKNPVTVTSKKYFFKLCCYYLHLNTQGESNSLLVLGPRGVGKSSLVREVLRRAAVAASWQQNAVVVQLSGHVQTDDRVALRYHSNGESLSVGIDNIEKKVLQHRKKNV